MPQCYSLPISCLIVSAVSISGIARCFELAQISKKKSMVYGLIYIHIGRVGGAEA